MAGTDPLCDGPDILSQMVQGWCDSLTILDACLRLRQVPPTCLVTRSSVQAIGPHTVPQLVHWDAVESDTGQMADLGVADYQVTAQEEGIYLVSRYVVLQQVAPSGQYNLVTSWQANNTTSLVVMRTQNWKYVDGNLHISSLVEQKVIGNGVDNVIWTSVLAESPQAINVTYAAMGVSWLRRLP